MTAGRVSFQTGYADIARKLAMQALSVARDGAPHRAREGELRWSMAEALPAARLLVGDACDSSAELITSTEQLKRTLLHPAGKVTDGFGHARPAYRWLALHLMGSAARLSRNVDAIAHLAQAARHCVFADENSHASDERLALWRRLIARQHGLAIEPADPINQTSSPAPLVPLGLNDLIDAWTYNELVGLHALHLGAVLDNSAELASRVHNAALFHLDHTQPDYTTYQPWALSAFASDAQTAVFAEQQLHDVATHLRLEGPGGAVLPALLLADASATMTGTIARAWRDR